MLFSLVSILFGAALTLAIAYALGSVLLRQTPAPPEIVLGLGAVAESLIVYLLLLANWGHWYVYLVLGALAFAGWYMTPVGPAGYPLGPPVRTGQEACRTGLSKGNGLTCPRLGLLILGLYGLWYFVNALAPEILADGTTYHLGLPYEYTRLGGFPDRITFYDMVPQGMEMLYTVAFAFGRHSAAKLVEFAFFAATLPLFFRIGRRFELSGVASLAAAVLYFCAPVAGATGASSYNDAAGVFFTLSALYLLLVWYQSGDTRHLLPAGALAGFCYVIKLPGAATMMAAVLFVLLLGGGKAALRTALGAAAVAAPWLLRNAVLASNPVAPLLNSVFPNPYFHIATERALAANLRSLGSVSAWRVPWELALGDHLVGTFGPLLLVLPLGLFALRRKAGWWLWAAAALLSWPWFSNSGARFLMPAVAVAAFPLVMVLPRPAAWAAIALQAVLCWPQVIDCWQTRYGFRLHEFPLAAALRIEPEDVYLERHLDEFTLAKIIEAKTPPDAKILGLLPVANAYLARDVRITWQSAEADRLLDTLRVAALPSEPLSEWKVSWPIASLERLRFRLTASGSSEYGIQEVRIYAGDELVYTSPNWSLRAWPNSWEAPLALDGNLATRWRTWEPVRAGTFFEIRFDHPQTISAAAFYAGSAPLEVYGGSRGRWRELGAPPSALRVRQDLRSEATLAIRRAGYRYLLVPTGSGGSAPIGNALLGREPEWGLERVAEAGPYYLFRVK
jgi:Dolichyl-phosphate-mannose-protein mannosyltransferase